MNLNTSILVVLLLLTPSIAHADYKDWSQERKNIFIAYNIISTIDYLQTASALSDPCECYQEANPFLGKDPSNAELLALNIVTSYMLYRWMDDPTQSTKLAKVATALRLGVVAQNHSIGVRIDFKL